MTGFDLCLRLARRSEAGAIAALSRDLIEYGLEWRWTPERVAASIRAANANVVLASVAEKIAAFAIMRYGDDDAHLDLLAVTPPHQRAGLGSQMLQWLEKCAGVAGTFKITLEVRERNAGAQLFYRRAGYRAVARLPGYYQGIEGALRMQRDLSDGRLQPNPPDLPPYLAPGFVHKLPPVRRSW